MQESHEKSGGRKRPLRFPHSRSNPSPQLASRFLELAEILACPYGLVLFQAEEPAHSVYLVVNGAIDLRLPVSGSSAIVFRAESGSLLGLPAVYSNQPFSMTAVVALDSEVAVMGRQEFSKMIASNVTFSMDVLRILAAETHAARIAISELERRDSEGE